jgi:diacylglycerol kinase (ATP)
MKELVFFVNPAAGSGRAGAVWDGLVAGHPELRGAALVRESDLARARERLTAALAAPEARALVAIGGDGTLHHVANVLLASGLAERIALGVVPAGTGSDLARTLGIPLQPSAALQLALEARPRAVDALRLRRADGTVRFALNTVSAGVSGLVVEGVNALARRRQTTYLAATVRALLRYRPLPCRVSVDGEPFYEGPTFLFAVANGPTFGNGMRVAPPARLDDGFAEVVVAGDIPRWQLPVYLPLLVLGRHLGRSRCRHRQGRSVRWEPLVPFPPFELDGETLAAGSAEITLLPAALRMLH